jgi:DNA (cytosine-5)-methyltransferase 1
MNQILRPSLELFAGAGGLGVGLAQAGFNPVEVVECNHWCCETLRENQKCLSRNEELWRLFEGDVREVDFRRLEDKIDLVSGGPPCQPFSLGGKHMAYNDQRDMFPQAVRAVRETRPKAFVFENVKGLTRAAFRNYLQYVQLQLEHPEVRRHEGEDWAEHLARLEQHHTSGRREGLNYQVVTQLLNAADYGVPQRRDRVVFVGFRDDVGARWSFPRPDYSHASLVWDQSFGDYWDRHKIAKSDRVLETRADRARARLSKDERPNEKPWQTVRDAFAGLPDPRTGGGKLTNHIFQDGARAYPGHTGSFIDEPSKALKAGVHGVPGGENMVRFADGSVRYFTVRESARLQTFPDTFLFHGAWTECMRQLGNAVPVELARRVGESIAEQMSRV